MPRVLEVHVLSTFHDLKSLIWVEKDICELQCKILRVSKFEIQQGIIAEIVLNTRSARRNDWLAQSQVLENPSRGINFRKYPSLVGNDTDIALFHYVDELLQSPRPR